MDVRVKKNFPSVYDYTMKKFGGKVSTANPRTCAFTSTAPTSN